MSPLTESEYKLSIKWATVDWVPHRHLFFIHVHIPEKDRFDCMVYDHIDFVDLEAYIAGMKGGCTKENITTVFEKAAIRIRDQHIKHCTKDHGTN